MTNRSKGWLFAALLSLTLWGVVLATSTHVLREVKHGLHLALKEHDTDNA